MDTLLDTDGPVVFAVNGETLSIPKATNRDYIPWLARLHSQRRDAQMKLIPPMMPPAERFKANKEIEKDKPTQWDLVALLNEPEGIDEVLKIVCAKLTDEQKEKVLALPQVRQYELAARASGLIPSSRLAAMFGPSQEELEQHALNLLHPLWTAMKGKGIDEKTAREVLLALPGITAELIDGKPSTPESPANPGTFGDAGKNG